VQARNSAFDNASIATVMTGGGNMAAGGATLTGSKPITVQSWSAGCVRFVNLT